VSRFIVKMQVKSPMRADANAASHPACPAPITIRSYVLVVVMNSYYKIIPVINASLLLPVNAGINLNLHAKIANL
jgi:hypothetical protein